MGKATRWFRGLLGLKNPDPPPPTTSSSTPVPTTNRRRWSFVKSYIEKSSTFSSQPPATHYRPVPDSTGPKLRPCLDAPTSTPVLVPCCDDANKHAIAVAAATAAVAEAAVATAHAAAAVVRLTTSGRSNNAVAPMYAGAYGPREAAAALLIQSHFRGYLARRALRALKGLVKLQALVRGHILRKKAAETIRCMHSIMRAQARARTSRVQIPGSPHSSSKSSQIHHPDPATPEKFEETVHFRNPKHGQSPNLLRNDSRSKSWVAVHQDRGYCCSTWSDPRRERKIWETQGPSISTDDDRTVRVLEIDPGKPHLSSKYRSLLFESPRTTHSRTTSRDSTAQSYEVQALNPLKLSREEDSYCTAESSPRFYSASSRGGSSKRGASTPTKSDAGSASFLSGCSDCPSYMAYTESAMAKVRSASAPRQRPNMERTASGKRHWVNGCVDSRSASKRVSAIHSSFSSKVYPGSGRLDRFGMLGKGNNN